MTTRTDVHRPSVIEPAEYEFVGQECFRTGFLGELPEFVLAERKRIADHMARTGGTYSQHEHGGNCMVCGSVNAIYTILFYHAKTNSYVRMGADCADKVYGQDFGSKAFRVKIENVRDAQKGKRKAMALLGDWKLSECWDIYTGEAVKHIVGRLPYEEATIIDIVAKLVKYGSISEKQIAFLRSLMAKCADRPAKEAKRAAEKAAAADCPEGKVRIRGTILSLKEQDSEFYGPTLKMLVKHESGYSVWGTVPSGMDAKRNMIVAFNATVTRSQSDPKFGFYKRPTKWEVISTPEAV